MILKIDFKRLAIILILLFILCPKFLFSNIIIKNKTSNINIDDLIDNTKDYDDFEVKKLCVSIIDRYHSLGYTSFHIKRATIKSNRDVELEFVEPVVSAVNLKDANGEIISLNPFDFYKIGELFNEVTLKENIKIAKKKYGLKKVSVDVNRVDEKNIELNIEITKKIADIIFGVYSHPIYGGMVHLFLERKGVDSYFSSAIDSSTHTGDMNNFYGNFFYAHSISCNGLFFFGDMDYNYRDFKESEREFSFSTIAFDFGVWSKNVLWDLYVSPSIEYCNSSILSIDKEISFAGLKIELKYSNESYKIDPLDLTKFDFKINAGWNNYEGKRVVRSSFDGEMMIPVEFFAISNRIDARYTNENSDLFHDYIFDTKLPLHYNYYELFKWRFVYDAGVVFDVFSRKLFLSPEFLLAFYENDSGIRKVLGYGTRLIYKTSNFFSELSFFADSLSKVQDGVILISAKMQF